MYTEKGPEPIKKPSGATCSKALGKEETNLEETSIAYRVIHTVSFEEALAQLKKGCTASRTAWQREGSPRVPVVTLGETASRGPFLVRISEEGVLQEYQADSLDLLAEDWFLFDADPLI